MDFYQRAKRYSIEKFTTSCTLSSGQCLQGKFDPSDPSGREDSSKGILSREDPVDPYSLSDRSSGSGHCEEGPEGNASPSPEKDHFKLHRQSAPDGHQPKKGL